MAQFATMTLCRMQPSERKHWICVQFPHSEESYGRVKAALAKAEVGTLLLLFTTPFSNHCPETTLHMTASVALHALVLRVCHPCSTMQLMTGFIMTIFIIATSLLKHRSSSCLQQHVRQTDMQNTLDKNLVAWQAAHDAVMLLEADIIAADAAAKVAKDKRGSCFQVCAECLPGILVCIVCCHSSCTVPC